MYYFTFKLSFRSQLTDLYLEDAEDFISKLEVSTDSSFSSSSTITLIDETSEISFSTENKTFYFRPTLIKGSKIDKIKLYRYDSTTGKQVGGGDISCAASELYPAQEYDSVKTVPAWFSEDPDNPVIVTVMCSGRLLMYDVIYDFNVPDGRAWIVNTVTCPRIQEKFYLRVVSSADYIVSGTKSTTTDVGYYFAGWSETKYDVEEEIGSPQYMCGEEHSTEYRHIKFYGVWLPVDVTAADFNSTYTDPSTGTEYPVTNTLNSIDFTTAYQSVDGTSYRTGWYFQLAFPTSKDKYNSSKSAGSYYMHAPDSIAAGSQTTGVSLQSNNVMYVHRAVISYASATSAASQRGWIMTKSPPYPICPTNENLVCTGWKLSTGAIVKVGEDIPYNIREIHAKWDQTGEDIITITLISDSATGTVFDTITTKKNVAVRFPTGYPSKVDPEDPTKNLIFAGWGNSVIAGTESDPVYVCEYYPGSKYTFSEDTTLYSVWTRALLESTDLGNSGIHQITIIDKEVNPSVTGTIPFDAFIIPSFQGYGYITYLYTTSLIGGHDPLDTTYCKVVVLLIQQTTGQERFHRRILSGSIGGDVLTIEEQGDEYSTISKQLVSQKGSSSQSGVNAYRMIRMGIDTDKLEQEDYEFTGWYTGQTTLENEGSATSAIEIYNGHLVSTKILSIKNGWSKIKPTTSTAICPLIRFTHVMCVLDPQGGTVDPTYLELALYEWKEDASGNQQKTVARFYNLPTPLYGSREFLGWFTERTGGTEIIHDQSVPEEQRTQITYTEDFVLYAHWGGTAEILYVYFVVPSGTSVERTSQAITYGQPYGELPVPTATGKTAEDALGWFTSQIGGTIVESTTTVTNPLPHYLYWKWKDVYYTITFDPNGGTVSPTTKQVVQGEQYGSFPTPQYIGYHCDGWYTAKEGGVLVTTTSIPLSDTTLYAHWTQGESVNWGYVRWKITFETNGGTIASSYGQYKYVQGDEKNLPTAEQTTKEGYTFDGWYDNAELTGTAITKIETTDKGNKKFYAKWTDG